jgi:hypothetical protein
LALARDLASRAGERETSSAESFVSPPASAAARRLERRDGESFMASTARGLVANRVRARSRGARRRGRAVV